MRSADLAEALEMAGDREARPTLRRALARYERKGSLVAVRRAAQRLAVIPA